MIPVDDESLEEIEEVRAYDGIEIIGSALQKAQYCHDPTKTGGCEALSLTSHSESP